MKVTTFAVDLAKQKFQVHGFSAGGEQVVVRAPRRGQFLEFFERREERCRVVMEACGSAHHWGRQLCKMGYQVELIAAQFTKPFVVGNKHDGNDADAIYEAGERRRIRRVPIKSEEQQAIQAVHRVRARLMRTRTALTNQLRGLLAEYGYVFGMHAAALRRGLAEVLEGDRIPVLMRELVEELREEWLALDDRILGQDRRLKVLYNASAACQRLSAVEGVGPVTATAFAGTVADIGAFKSGRDFAAWLGVTPSEYSSGETRRLGRITKRGDRYLRTLLIHGGRAAVKAARGKEDPRSQWINAVATRRGVNKAAVAVANKNARIIWALLTRDDSYRRPTAA